MKRLSVLVLLLVGCSGAAPTAPPAEPPVQPTPQVVYVTPIALAQPTPQVIYITPAPTVAVSLPTPQIVYVTPEPTPTLTAVPTSTPEPTPSVTPEPTVAFAYNKLTARAWAKIVKTPDNYIGKGFQLWSCIYQFDAATGPSTFLANASYQKLTYWNLDGESTQFTGDADQLGDYVKDDIVFMKVISTGSYSFDTQAGGNTTVPAFEITSISRKGSCG